MCRVSLCYIPNGMKHIKTQHQNIDRQKIEATIDNSLVASRYDNALILCLPTVTNLDSACIGIVPASFNSSHAQVNLLERHDEEKQKKQSQVDAN